MLAHSERLVLPMMTAPAARNFAATPESCLAMFPTNANEPAVVIILSAVSMLSLIRTGTPCMGPRGPLALYSLSSESAMASASGLVSMTALMVRLSISAMRCKYFCVSERAVYLPDFKPAAMSAMVSSSSSKDGAGVYAAFADTGIANAAPTASDVERKLRREVSFAIVQEFYCFAASATDSQFAHHFELSSCVPRQTRGPSSQKTLLRITILDCWLLEINCKPNKTKRNPPHSSWRVRGF